MDAILTRKLKQAGDEFLPGEAYVKKWGYPLDKTGTGPEGKGKRVLAGQRV